MEQLKHFVLTVLLALVSSLSANAYDFEVDGIYYNVLSSQKQTCEVTYGTNKYSGVVKIPTSVTFDGNVYSVVEIGGYAFNDCIGLTSVTIPSSVTSLVYGTFQGCSSLTSVTIPNSITNIESNVFFGCI